MRTLALGFICLAAVGCGGEEDSVSGVFPSSAFIGRTVRVQVTGDNTNWDGGTRLDFGPGITVEEITVASPTALFANIAISDTAAPGLHDVVVSGSGDDLVLASAFELASPIAVDFRGTLAQGSVVTFTVNNMDFFSPFDDTCTAPSLFGCSEYGNVSVEGPPGALVFLDLVSPYTLAGTMYLDLDAAPGPFNISSGATGVPATISSLGAQLEIAARTATPIAGGMVTTTVAAAYDTHLYEVDAGANSLMRFSSSTSGTAPTIYVLDETGSFAGAIAAGAAPNAISQTGGKYYVVVENASGESGYSYTLRANPLTLTPLAEADASGANNTAATAQVASSAAVLVTGGSITSDTDADWYSFTVPAQSGTKKVRVITAGGDDFTDVRVEVFGDGAGGPAAPGTAMGPAVDNSYHENVTTQATVGMYTTIYVKIDTDPQYYDPSYTNYVAAIWLE